MHLNSRNYPSHKSPKFLGSRNISDDLAYIVPRCHLLVLDEGDYVFCHCFTWDSPSFDTRDSGLGRRKFVGKVMLAHPRTGAGRFEPLTILI